MFSDTPLPDTARRTLWFVALSLACWSGLQSVAAAAPPDAMEQVARATRLAQSGCQMKLHHDADEFVDCIDDMLKATRGSAHTRLGIEYFGWVGALNSARMSLPGAMGAADRYLRQFRKTQKRLHVTDDALCKTVPGDCRQRNARMLEMEAQRPMNATRFDDPSLPAHAKQR